MGGFLVPPAAQQAASRFSNIHVLASPGPPKLLQVVNVDHYGFALLNMENLGGLGGSRDSPIILKLSKPQV